MLPEAEFWRGCALTIPLSTPQPCNRSSPTRRSADGSSSKSAGNGSPRTSLAGRPLRSSRFFRNPPSKAAATRREIEDLSSFKAPEPDRSGELRYCRRQAGGRPPRQSRALPVYGRINALRHEIRDQRTHCTIIIQSGDHATVFVPRSRCLMQQRMGPDEHQYRFEIAAEPDRQRRHHLREAIRKRDRYSRGPFANQV